HSAKRRRDVHVFSALNQHKQHQQNADHNVQNQNRSNHFPCSLRFGFGCWVSVVVSGYLTTDRARGQFTISAKEFGSRLAPPTRAPSISSWALRPPMFSDL